MRQIAIGDIFTKDELDKASRLYDECKGVGFNKRVVAEIITPEVLARINKKLGQENDPSYLGYALESALMKVSRTR